MQHITPTLEEKAKIESVLNAKFPATLKTVAQMLGTTELEAAQKMPPEMVAFLKGDIKTQFAELWQELATWQKVTLFIVCDGHIFEIQAPLTIGKESHGFYNILDHNATIGGHLLPSALKTLAFLQMPFMGRESLSLQFFNEKDEVSFSIYVGRENHQLIESVKEAFFKAKAQFC